MNVLFHSLGFKTSLWITFWCSAHWFLFLKCFKLVALFIWEEHFAGLMDFLHSLTATGTMLESFRTCTYFIFYQMYDNYFLFLLGKNDLWSSLRQKSQMDLHCIDVLVSECSVYWLRWLLTLCQKNDAKQKKKKSLFNFTKMEKWICLCLFFYIVIIFFWDTLVKGVKTFNFVFKG